MRYIYFWQLDILAHWESEIDSLDLFTRYLQI